MSAQTRHDRKVRTPELDHDTWLPDQCRTTAGPGTENLEKRICSSLSESESEELSKSDTTSLTLPERLSLTQTVTVDSLLACARAAGPQLGVRDGRRRGLGAWTRSQWDNTWIQDLQFQVVNGAAGAAAGPAVAAANWLQVQCPTRG